MPYERDTDKSYPAATEQELHANDGMVAAKAAIDYYYNNSFLLRDKTIWHIWNDCAYHLQPVVVYLNEYAQNNAIAIYRKQIIKNHISDKIRNYINALE